MKLHFRRWFLIPVALLLAVLALPVVMFGQGGGSQFPLPGLSFFVRGLMIRNMPVDGYAQTADINARGDLMTAQALPERAELVRLGNSWVVADTTGVAAVTALPTTTASDTIWNGEPDGGKTYVVDRVFCNVSTSAAAASAHALVGMLNKGPVAAPTAVALTVSTLNGRNYGGKAVVARSATVTDDKWWPLPGSSALAGAASATTTIGLTIESQLNGLVLIPPRHQFSVSEIAVNTTEVCKFGFQWHEVQMPIVY